ncbi:MAG: TonB-dependent receptor [Vicinamibacterales bacterium]
MFSSRLFARTFSLSSILLTFVVLPVFAQSPVRGRVVDSSGTPIPGAVVSMTASDGGTSTRIADTRGEFVFADTCNRCRVSARLTGFVPASTSPTGNAPVVLTLGVAPISESVVVTATRTEVPTSQVGASVTVFDAAAIARRGDVLVGDLLRQAPGVTVVQNGGRGSISSLFVRGGENNYTKVLLDGIPLNEPGGTFNFGGLSTGHLERVELVRGAQSAVFGSDAVAGVLQLVSHRGRPGARPSGAAEITGGGYGTRGASGRISGGSTRWTWSAFGGRQETDNRVPNNTSTLNTGSVTLGGQLSNTLRVNVVGRIEETTTGTPGQTAFGRPDMDASFTQVHRIGGVSVEHQRARVSQRFTYALAYSRQRSTNLIADPPYTPRYGDAVAPFQFSDFTFDSGSTFRRHHASYQADLRLTHGGALAGAELLTVAADFDGERADLRDFLNAARTTPSRNNVGVSLQHQHVSGRLAVTTGLRFEDNASFGSSVTPRISASLLVRTGDDRWGATRVKVNAGTGIKEPTLRQSFSLSPFDLGNPDLDPERSRTIDAGVEQRLFNDRVKVEFTAFDNEFRDQIATRTIDFTTFNSQYFNVGLTRARGLEAGVEVALTPGVRIIANHTVLDSEIIDRASEFSEALAPGMWALRRPRHSGQATLFVDRGRVSFDLGAAWTGRRNDADFSSLTPPISTAPGYTLWRTQVAVTLTGQLTAFGRIENLTDEDYMEPLGYPAWRRTAHAGLRLKF